MSRWYGFPCWDLSPVEKIALAGHMVTLKAEEELAEGNVSDERVYDVVLAATGSEERASSAYTARLAWRMERESLRGCAR